MARVLFLRAMYLITTSLLMAFGTLVYLLAYPVVNGTILNAVHWVFVVWPLLMSVGVGVLLAGLMVQVRIERWQQKEFERRVPQLQGN